MKKYLSRIFSFVFAALLMVTMVPNIQTEVLAAKKTTVAAQQEKAKKAYKNFLKSKKFHGKKQYDYAVVTLSSKEIPVLLVSSVRLTGTGTAKITTNAATLYSWQKGKVKKIKTLKCSSSSVYIGKKKGQIVYAKNHRSCTMVSVKNGKLSGKEFVEKYNKKTKKSQYYQYTIKNGKISKKVQISSKKGIHYIYEMETAPIYFKAIK